MNEAHLPTGGVEVEGGPDYLGHVGTYLRSLGQGPPSPEARREVESYLSNKWQGLQAIAAQVLGAWGGKESERVLWDLLLDRYHKKYWWAIRGVAIKSLAGFVEDMGVDAVLNHYFGQTDPHLCHELLPLVAALPAAACRDRLKQESRSPAEATRHATLKAVVWMPLPNKPELLLPLATDPVPMIRQVAVYWLVKIALYMSNAMTRDELVAQSKCGISDVDAALSSLVRTGVVEPFSASRRYRLTEEGKRNLAFVQRGV